MDSESKEKVFVHNLKANEVRGVWENKFMLEKFGECEQLRFK